MARLPRKGRKMLSFMALAYGLYLLKTLMGINLFSGYSAAWIFKAPLIPIEENKGKLCSELESVCHTRKTVQNKLNRGLNKVKKII